VAYWTYGFDTEDMVWSPKMFRIFKLDASGDPLSWSEAKDLLHPDDRPRLRQRLDALLETGQPFSEQVRVVDGAGNTIVLEGTTMLLRDSQGQPRQLVGVVWNTAKDTDRLMKISHLKSVHDDLGLGFFSFDRHQSQTDWGRATFDLLHLDPDVDGTALETLLGALHPEDRQAARAAFSEAWAEGEGFAFTARVVPAGGAVERVAIKGQAWRNKAGVITHLFGSIRGVPQQAE
jgi:chemotaxis protein methyltransferase CheR/two-component system CheB/CheR fusion protein